MKNFFESFKKPPEKTTSEKTTVEDKNSPQETRIPRQEDDIAQSRIDTSLDIDYVLKNTPYLLEYWGEGRIKEVIRSLARLIIELEDQITNYDTIISDDASGRLISLFLREVINTKKAELEKEPVQTFFIAGGRHHDERINNAIQQFISEKKFSIDKALLVTEHIESGRSIESVAIILEKGNIDFDIASLSVANPQIFEELEVLKTKKIIYGSDSSDRTGLSFYNKTFTGVSKTTDKISAHPTKNQNTHSGNEKIRIVRQEIKFIAGEISKIILEKKK